MLEIPAINPAYRVVKLKPLKKEDSHTEQQLPQKKKQPLATEQATEEPIQHIDEIV